MKNRTPLLLVLAAFAVALAARTIHLYWSPLPATLDGIGYAAQARDAIALGRYPLADLRADNLVFAGLLTAVGVVLDERPLILAQPTVAILGAASCLVGVAIVHRAGRERGWAARRVRYAAAFAALALAVSGLYLRRTSVPDEEALAFLLLPLLALGLHRFLRTGRPGWGLATGLLLVTFPLVHTFSTLIAALTITALFVVHLHARPTRRTALVGGALVGGFWIYFAAYYELAARTALTVPYVGRVTAYPGLFLAWVLVLVVGVLWVRSASRRARRAAVLLPIGAWFVVLLANSIAPVFPGTVATRPLLIGVLLLYLLPLAAASASAPVLGEDRTGAVLLALLAAPVVHVGFSLTAALTPEFFGTAMRTQTFAHLPVYALAALTVGSALAAPIRELPAALRAAPLRPALVVLLVASVLVTAPLAFVALDTLAFPSTTTQEEFAGATFAATHLDEPWATDHKRSRMAVHYYDAPVAVGAVADWLRGGAAPGCPVLATADWTTTGAHLFPAAPETLDRATYDEYRRSNHLVYATAGRQRVSMVRPVGERGAC